MADSGPTGDPFEGVPFLGDIARMLGQQGGGAWDSARQLAVSVATGGADGTARLWDPASGKQVGRTMDHKRRVVRVAFSPDGRRLATASLDRTAQLWDAASGHALLSSPLQHAGPALDRPFAREGPVIEPQRVRRDVRSRDVEVGTAR